MDPATETDLLARAGCGDEAAFNRLVLAHTSYVHRLALRYTQDPGGADDVTQGVFLALWRQAPRWSGGARLRTWLYRVAVNRCIDLARARRRRAWLGFGPGETAPDLDAMAADSPGPESELDARRDLALTRTAIADLAPRQRMALVLTAVEGLSGAEAAATMDITPGALEQLLVRARSRLRSTLGKDQT